MTLLSDCRCTYSVASIRNATSEDLGRGVCDKFSCYDRIWSTLFTVWACVLIICNHHFCLCTSSQHTCTSVSAYIYGDCNLGLQWTAHMQPRGDKTAKEECVSETHTSSLCHAFVEKTEFRERKMWHHHLLWQDLIHSFYYLSLCTHHWQSPFRPCTSSQHACTTVCIFFYIQYIQ